MNITRSSLLLWTTTLVSAALPCSATVYNLHPGDNLQTFVNRAVGGDTIVLSTDYVYVGTIILPNRPDQNWVTIQSAGLASMPPGVRVTPSQSNLMPKLISPISDPVIKNDSNNPDHRVRPVHHYQFIGIEMTTTFSLNYSLVYFDPGDNGTAADIPSYITIDRCYIHGNLAGGQQIRGVMGNVSHLVVENSWLSDFASTISEANAIGTISTPGTIRILNNYLEAAGENVIFEGVVSNIPGLFPNNIVISHNYFYKQPAWRGSAYIVKNHLEFKAGKNITIDSNVFENEWAAQQSGAMILFTPRTGSGAQPHYTVQNVTFTNNVLRHTSKGVVLLNYDDQAGLPNSQLVAAANFLFRNNLMEDVSGLSYGDRGQAFLIFGPPSGLTLDHNTLYFSDVLNQNGAYPTLDAGWWFANGVNPSNMVATNNMFGWQLYGDGVIGPDAVPPGTMFSNNTILNVEPGRQAYWQQKYPDVRFVDDGTRGANLIALRASEPAIKSGH